MNVTKHFDELLFAILLLTSISLLYIAFIKIDAVDLEVIKSGGTENFKLIKNIYSDPNNSTQQRNAIQEGLNSLGIQ